MEVADTGFPAHFVTPDPAPLEPAGVELVVDPLDVDVEEAGLVCAEQEQRTTDIAVSPRPSARAPGGQDTVDPVRLWSPG